MKLIIAEKPSVQKDLKNTLEPSANFISGGTKGIGYYKGNNFIFACSLGHIITQKLPKEINESYALWDINCLPYAIKPIPLKIGESPAKDYYNILKNIIIRENYDELIVATDPDREGQGIFERIKQFMPEYPKGIKETRMWIKEWTYEGLRDAYDNRDDNELHKGLGDSAECRAYYDYIIGMNGTCACTTKFGNGEVLSVGRVQTPITKIIVDRENEINNFKRSKYFEVSLKINAENGEFLKLNYETKDRLDEASANNLLSRLRKYNNAVVEVTKTDKTKKQRKLGGQTDFLQIMDKKYGLDPKKTSDALQQLYQTHKLTTYPGTEAHEISKSASKDAIKPLKNLLGKVDEEVDGWVKRIMDNQWDIAPHCIATKDLPHEAITPVFGAINTDSINSLSSNEKRLYKEIIRVYAQSFYPEMKYQETKIYSTLDDEKFNTKGRVITEKGFTELMSDEKDKIIPKLINGEAYQICDYLKEEKETNPPKRFNVSTLLDAMKNAGRFIDDKRYADILKNEEVEGLGTGRTRSIILNNLKLRGYYTVKGKSIYATQTALDLINVLPKNIIITSPILTAKMEEELMKVENGEMTKESYMNKADETTAEMIDSIKNSDGKVASKNETGEICPECGGKLVKRKGKYGDFVACSNYPECKYIKPKQKSTKKSTNEICPKCGSPMVWKKGKYGDFLSCDNYPECKYIKPKQKEKTKETGEICPECGGKLIERTGKYGKFISCSNYPECKYVKK